MLIKVFKSNFPGLISGLFILQALLWLDLFIVKQNINMHATNHAIIFDFARQYFQNYYLNLGTAFALTFINALLINHITFSFDLNSQKTYLPALLYITFMSANNSIMYLQPALFASFFLIILIKRLCLLYYNPEDLTEIFNVGILTGLASLILFQSVVFIAFVWFSMIILQVLSLRKWVITILGFFTPYIFIVTYLFLFDKLQVGLLINITNTFCWPWELKVSINSQQISVISYILFLVIISFATGIVRLNENIIKTRKMLSVLTWFVLTGLISITFVSVPIFTLLLISAPLAVFISGFLIRIKKQWTKELMYLILLAIIVINKLQGLL